MCPARPPVAIVSVSSPSSARRRRDDRRRPGRRSRRRCRCGSRRPSTCRSASAAGRARSCGSAAARLVSASIEISTPGVMMPPRYSPSADTGSKVIAVPKSTTTHGAADLLVRRDGVDEAVGADLARVVVADRHAGPDARARRRASRGRGSGSPSPSTRRRAAGPSTRRSRRRGRRGPRRAARAGCAARRRARRPSTRAPSRSASARRARRRCQVPKWVWVLPTSTTSSTARQSMFRPVAIELYVVHGSHPCAAVERALR